MKRLTALLIVLSVTPAAGDELDLIKSVLAEIQPRSFEENREYCGYVGYDFEGKLTASEPTPGNEDSCLADDPTQIETITASYHTHGAFSLEHSSETPSGSDMEADEEEGIDGWVATPGGRLWFIDTTDMVATQVCGIGCLPQDPRFVQGDMGHIDESYHYDELVEFLDAR